MQVEVDQEVLAQLLARRNPVLFKQAPKVRKRLSGSRLGLLRSAWSTGFVAVYQIICFVGHRLSKSFLQEIFALLD